MTGSHLKKKQSLIVWQHMRARILLSSQICADTSPFDTLKKCLSHKCIFTEENGANMC